MLLTVPLFSGFAQDTATEKKVETPANKKDFEKAIIETMLENKDFVFNATDMMPRGGGNVNLGYDYDVQIKNDMMISYLPFIGISYNPVYGSHNSGFDFTQPITSYEVKEKRKGYRVEVEVKNNSDNLKYTFHITDTGSSTLTVASSKRQSIAFYGTIDPIK